MLLCYYVITVQKLKWSKGISIRVKNLLHIDNKGVDLCIPLLLLAPAAQEKAIMPL